MKKKYSLYVSLGAACSCSETLRRHGLQLFSYPLDWCCGSSFLTRIQCLIDGYRNFFNKEDFQFVGPGNSIHDTYKNTRTGIIFKHDFAVDVPFDSQYPALAQKYERRINRLLKQLEQADTVCFVYMCIPAEHTPVPDAELLQGYHLLQESFKGKEIGLVYLFNNGAELPQKTDVFLTAGVRKICFGYQEPGPAESWGVDRYKLRTVFKDYVLDEPYWVHLKRKVQKLFYKVASGLILSKQKRRNFRKKHHLNY